MGKIGPDHDFFPFLHKGKDERRRSPPFFRERAEKGRGEKVASLTIGRRGEGWERRGSKVLHVGKLQVDLCLTGRNPGEFCLLYFTIDTI